MDRRRRGDLLVRNVWRGRMARRESTGNLLRYLRPGGTEVSESFLVPEQPGTQRKQMLHFGLRIRF